MIDWSKIDIDTVLTGSDENGNRYLRQFFKAYKDAFPGVRPDWACQRCFNRNYAKLIKSQKEMKTKPKNSGYILKKKYQNIPLGFGSPIYVNNANITDEMGATILARKNGAKYFDSVPSKDTGEAKQEDNKEVKLKISKEDTKLESRSAEADVSDVQDPVADFHKEFDIDEDEGDENDSDANDEINGIDEIVNTSAKLMQLTRKELDKKAQDLGLSPSKYSNKGELADAIIDVESIQ